MCGVLCVVVCVVCSCGVIVWWVCRVRSSSALVWRVGVVVFVWVAWVVVVFAVTLRGVRV